MLNSMVEYENGNKHWFLNDQLHREDGPAIEFSNGDKYWYLNDKLHREDGPAAEFANGNKKWYLNGKLHRADGPAVECANGYKEWYVYGYEIKANTKWQLLGIDDWGYSFVLTKDRYFKIRVGYKDFTIKQALKYWKNNDEVLVFVHQAEQLIKEGF